MNGGCNCVQKPVVSVGSKVHDNLSTWRDGPGHFNIENHFAIVTIRRGRIVETMVNGRRLNRRRRYIQTGKILGEICVSKTTAQLNDGYALSFPGNIFWKTISVRYFVGSKAIKCLCDATTNKSSFFLQLKHWPCERPVVKPKHTFYYFFKIFWKINSSGSSIKSMAIVVLVLGDVNPERGFEVFNFAS